MVGAIKQGSTVTSRSPPCLDSGPPREKATRGHGRRHPDSEGLDLEGSQPQPLFDFGCLGFRSVGQWMKEKTQLQNWGQEGM